MNKKYKLLQNNIIKTDNKTLYRIKALRDFGDVNKGDLGGYIESEDNLSHDDNCWVYGNARVYSNVRVYGNARVFGNARVSSNAWVYDNAWVYGNAQVFGNVQVCGNARVYGNAWVFGDVQVYGDARVFGNEYVYDDDAKVYDNARVSKNTILNSFIKIDKKHNVDLPPKEKSNNIKLKETTKVQKGGSHYKSMNMQPIDYIYHNNLNFLEGNVVKYVSRWKNKNGLEDLEKAKHYIEMLIEFEKLRKK